MGSGNEIRETGCKENLRNFHLASIQNEQLKLFVKRTYMQRNNKNLKFRKNRPLIGRALKAHLLSSNTIEFIKCLKFRNISDKIECAELICSNILIAHLI